VGILGEGEGLVQRFSLGVRVLAQEDIHHPLVGSVEGRTAVFGLERVFLPKGPEGQAKIFFSHTLEFASLLRQYPPAIRQKTTRMLEIPPLYPITDAGCGVPLSEQVVRFADAGFPLVQFRGKPLGPKEQWAELRKALAWSAGNGGWPLVIVNDRADLATLAALEGLAPWGVHLGQTDLPASCAARLPAMGGLHFGASTHNPCEWSSVDSACDHAGVGPFRATATKPGHDETIGPEGLQNGCSYLRSQGVAPIAIGGLTLEDAPFCFAAGAESLAMSKALSPESVRSEGSSLPNRLWQAQKIKFAHRSPVGRGNGVAIVGGSGAGKTTLAASLAERMGMAAIDLDARIAQKSGSTVAEVFGKGEAPFRELEGECLPECMERPAVLALGAGAWQQEGVRRRVAEAGWDVLWLAEDPRRAWERVGGDPARPLAAERSEFMRRWRSRMAEWSLLPQLLPLGRTPDELAGALLGD
jgi:thiamine-phosphate pyrophosphorylase